MVAVLAKTSTALMAATLYITVGPPCSGKTTWIKQKKDNIVDVSIDDQPGVYRPVPFNYFVTLPEGDVPQLQELIEGKTIRDRIMADDQQELKLLCRYWAGAIDKADVSTSIQSLHAKSRQGHSSDLAKHITTALEKVDCTKVPETIDLFCKEALFKGAIADALQRLCRVSPSTPVAWGNTNLRNSDYEEVLEHAQRQDRPVRFIAWNGTSSLRLEPCSFEELLRRNFARCLRTGRYVPASVLWDMTQRVDKLGNSSDMERHLARAAGFDWNLDTFKVRRVSRGTNQYHRPRHGGRHDINRGAGSRRSGGGWVNPRTDHQRRYVGSDRDLSRRDAPSGYDQRDRRPVEDNLRNEPRNSDKREHWTRHNNTGNQSKRRKER